MDIEANFEGNVPPRQGRDHDNCTKEVLEKFVMLKRHLSVICGADEERESALDRIVKRSAEVTVLPRPQGDVAT
jgi:hypothetical protein